MIRNVIPEPGPERDEKLRLRPPYIKVLREMTGLKQSEAAALVHVQQRTWTRWEQPADRAGKRWMPEMAIELFCIKAGIFYPPQFDVEVHDGIVEVKTRGRPEEPAPEGGVTNDEVIGAPEDTTPQEPEPPESGQGPEEETDSGTQ